MERINNNIDSCEKKILKNPKMYFENFTKTKNKKNYFLENNYNKIFSDYYNYYGFNNLDMISLGDTLYFLENYILIQLLKTKLNLLNKELQKNLENNNILKLEIKYFSKIISKNSTENFIIPNYIFYIYSILYLILLMININNIIKILIFTSSISIYFIKDLYDKFKIIPN